jgi:REP element-mobilizing transposase RayT
MGIGSIGGSESIGHRRSIRIKGFDYTSNSAYFVSICTKDQAWILGEVVNDAVQLSDLGQICQECWMLIPNHFTHTKLDRFVVMPNHVHGILFLGERDAIQAHKVPEREQFGRPIRGSLPTIIRSYKSAASRLANKTQGTTGASFWQRDYHERVIRDEKELNAYRDYIISNPSTWESDKNNPNQIGTDEFDLWLKAMQRDIESDDDVTR